MLDPELLELDEECVLPPREALDEGAWRSLLVLDECLDRRDEAWSCDIEFELESESSFILSRENNTNYYCLMDKKKKIVYQITEIKILSRK